jgi:hypothetical protein
LMHEHMFPPRVDTNEKPFGTAAFRGGTRRALGRI